MKRPLLFACIAIALLYAVRSCEYAGIRRNKTGEFAKLRESFEEKNNYDLLVIGSSRAECEFYTPRMDSLTGLKTYNIGMTGAVMPFIRATLEAYLVHSNPPKYVVLNLDLHSFSDNADTVYGFPRYFAYLDNEKLYEGLKARDKRFPYFRYFAFYSMPYFTSKYFNASLRGWLDKPGKYNSDYIKGFAPHVKNTMLGDFDTMRIEKMNFPVPDYEWQEIDRIHAICKANGIKLIFALVPLYHRWEERVTNYSGIVEKVREYALQQNIPFINLAHDSIRFDKNLYSDPAHLDKEGALLFTRHFCDSLGQYIGR